MQMKNFRKFHRPEKQALKVAKMAIFEKYWFFSKNPVSWVWKQNYALEGEILNFLHWIQSSQRFIDTFWACWVKKMAKNLILVDFDFSAIFGHFTQIL